MMANNVGVARVQYYQSATSPPSSTYLVSSTDRRVDSPHRNEIQIRSFLAYDHYTIVIGSPHDRRKNSHFGRV